MLRITVQHRKKHKNAACLVLEGQLRDEWCDMLERLCHGLSSEDIVITLDMSGVTYVDDRGVSLIKAMLARRTKLTGCNMFLEALFDRKILTPATQFRT